MNHSFEQEANKLFQRVLLVLGPRIDGFYRQQFVALDDYLNRMLERHKGCQDTITDAEIEGAYEMVTEHLFPHSAEEINRAVAAIDPKTQSQA